MKVYELREILDDLDSEADVYIMSQESWPFENDVVGVITRGDISSHEVDEDVEADEGVEAEPWTDHDRWAAPESRLPATDVFLVEGRQLRYGSRGAWDTHFR
jgi:hypothetical protein